MYSGLPGTHDTHAHLWYACGNAGNTYAQLLGSSQRLNGYNQLEEECGK